MQVRVVALLINFFAFLTFLLPSPSLFRKVPILAKTRSRVKTAITFSRQNDAGSRASPIYCWENLVLVVVLVLESKDKIINHWFIILLYHYKSLCASWQVSLEGHLVLLGDRLNERCNISFSPCGRHMRNVRCKLYKTCERGGHAQPTLPSVLVCNINFSCICYENYITLYYLNKRSRLVWFIGRSDLLWLKFFTQQIDLLFMLCHNTFSFFKVWSKTGQRLQETHTYILGKFRYAQKAKC